MYVCVYLAWIDLHIKRLECPFPIVHKFLGTPTQSDSFPFSRSRYARIIIVRPYANHYHLCVIYDICTESTIGANWVAISAQYFCPCVSLSRISIDRCAKLFLDFTLISPRYLSRTICSRRDARLISLVINRKNRVFIFTELHFSCQISFWQI